jgi:hypothetical protein
MACSTYEGEKEWLENFDGKPERKRPLGRPRCRCMYNIKIFLRGIRWGGVD